MGGFALSQALTGTTSLRILCYHGISLADEHEFQPSCSCGGFPQAPGIPTGGNAHPVLGLGEALALLEAGRLPPRAVVITFDDGWVGTATAAPALQEFSFPSTLCVTTRDVLEQVPVFDVLRCHLLWKEVGQIDARRWGSAPASTRWIRPATANGPLTLLGKRHRAVMLRASGSAARKSATTLQVNWCESSGLRCFASWTNGKLAELPARGNGPPAAYPATTFRGRRSGGFFEIEQNRAALQAAARPP